MTQLTVTGPFINRTLFEQAGIEVPEGETWEEWAEVTRQVAEATGTPYAMVMDRTGHRLAGPAISQGAQIFDAEGFPRGRRRRHAPMMQLMIDWHADGTMDPDVWIGSAGLLRGRQRVLHQRPGRAVHVGQLADRPVRQPDRRRLRLAGRAQPLRPGRLHRHARRRRPRRHRRHRPPRRGRPGDGVPGPGRRDGRVLRPHPLHPRPPRPRRVGVDFVRPTTSRRATPSTSSRARSRDLHPTAYACRPTRSTSSCSTTIRDRLTQVFVGELTLDEALERIQADIDEALREAGAR
jgi:alpha-1,4-digalacturonate transport system substrate-binding protein